MKQGYPVDQFEYGIEVRRSKIQRQTQPWQVWEKENILWFFSSLEAAREAAMAHEKWLGEKGVKCHL